LIFLAVVVIIELFELYAVDYLLPMPSLFVARTIADLFPFLYYPFPVGG